MYQDLYPRPRRGGSILMVVGWVIAIVVGIGLVWYGFTWTEENGQPEEISSEVGSPTPTQMAVWPTATPLPPSPPASPVPPTATPLPTVEPQPTPIPATPTVANALAVVGIEGVNVRTGPGTNFTRLGYLDPDTQIELIGRYSDWWQIRYNDAPAWVFGDLVTASNADNVPQVEPPASPIPPTAVPATAVPTAVPATATPATYRGLVPTGYQVEGAPGPYGVDANIWFNMWIKNTSGTTVEFQSLGTLVEETGQYQQSWTYSEFQPGQQFDWRDHVNIPAAGTYHLWMTLCFRDGQCVKMSGPVEVIVQ